LKDSFISTHYPDKEPKLKDILGRVENRVFGSRTRALDAFRLFDTDCDGNLVV
jgi:hypothetical protein